MIHISPNNSKDHQYLRSLASNIGVSESSIRQFLFSLNAPGYLVSLVRIMHNLLAGFEHCTQKHGITFKPGNLMHDAHLISKYIASHRNEMRINIGDHVIKGERITSETSRLPTHGLLVRHPIYTALWHTNEDTAFEKQYRLLQTQIYFACSFNMHRHSKRAEYEDHEGKHSLLLAYNSSFDHACRNLRKLSTDEFTTHLEMIYEAAIAPKIKTEKENTLTAVMVSFVNLLLDLKTNAYDSQTQDILNSFTLLLKQAYQGKKAQNRESGRHATVSLKSTYGYDNITKSISSQCTMRNDFDDIDHHLGTQRVIKVSQNTAQSAQVDNAPTENDSGTELYLTEYDGELPSFLARIFAARGQVRHITMRNQMLRTSWSQMTTWEVAQLLVMCHTQWTSFIKVIEETADAKAKNVAMLGLESITLIMIMLWTGKQLEEAVSIVIGNKDTIEDSALAFIQDTNQWRLLPFMLTEKAKVSEQAITMSRQREAYVYLPCVIKVGAFFKGLQAKTSGSLFNHDITVYQARIQSLLSELPEGNRVTSAKISTYIFHLLATESTADVTDAIIATATYHSLGQTQLHYTTPQSSYIQVAYQHTVTQVVTDVYKEAIPRDITFLEPLFSLSHVHLGSRLCPKAESIKILVNALHAKISMPPNSLNTQEVINYHNYFTIYTCLMVGYATGYRAVRDPFFHSSDIDMETGLAIISDKDTQEYYNTRLVWIPDVVIQQMHHYTMHVKKLERWFKKSTYPDSWADHSSMFLLSDDLHIKELRPKHVLPFIKDVFPFPLNVNRRYLRTELKQRGCPTEIINAFMGHWQLGEEPWGQHSTLSMTAYIKALREHIEPILQELSWVEMKSMVT